MADIRETCVNYIQGEPTATVYTSERKWVSRLTELAEKYPDEVSARILADGITLRATMPPNWVFKFRPPRKMSDEQRAKAVSRLQSYQKAHNT